METIEEQSKSEMSISPSPSPENLRICLVGDAANDPDTVAAAQYFGVPVITSETGLEIVNDYDWRTYFVLTEFGGDIYETIHKSKQCILGPPALKHAADMKDGLIHNARPLYNYAMRGVVTCFTGIRKKDELTKLVNLIHSMGGCIRKDMNVKITHLICNQSGGDKYKYAKTFRLTVVRPAWVYAAWERRNEMQFRATTDDFSKDHKLKAFEGQKICFFGFPADEHQHMVDVLQSNGGVPAELDDPECSHVVMPNSGGYFPEAITNTVDSLKTLSHATNLYPSCNPNEMEVDIDAAVQMKESAAGDKENVVAENVDTDDDDDDDIVPFDERLVVDYDCNKITAEQGVVGLSSPLSADLDEDENTNTYALNEDVRTPKSSKHEHKIEIDGIVLSKDDENEFQQTNKISPILGAEKLMPDNIEGAEDELDDAEQFELDLKRKRESFDSISLASTDSFAQPTSTKKPKLIRTGSITRSIRRSMSFVAVRTPIAKILRPRRSSVALDTAPNDTTTNVNEADISICSFASVENTFNESIRKPVKEKLRSIRERITRSSSSKKDKYMLNVPQTPERPENETDTASNAGFKTPKAPGKFSITASRTTTPKSSFKFKMSAHGQGADFSSTNTGVGTAQLASSTNKSLSSLTVPVTATICPSPQLASKQDTMSSAAQESEVATVTVHPKQRLSNISQIDAGSVTNTVVDEHTTSTKPEPKNNRTHILKSDWFWYSIQNGYAEETDYLFGDYLDSIANTPNTDRRDSLPISFNKRKRKRFSQRIQLEGTPLGSGKRRSSVSDAGLLSVSSSFFDCTTSPDKLESGKLLIEPETPTSEQTPAKKSMRFNHFMDFFSTESNYVGILDTIVNLFKNPLEDIAETSDALLNKSEIKSIFNNFVPIHEVHRSMLERLRTIHSKWTEDCSIGEIILQHRDELIKAYPPYVNFFEQMKETLQQCDSQNPRFHAFLKINQTKPECGRQSLQDLMIRPVQRLPSISLLLKDILKHTNKNNPDYAKLEQALMAIKEVMTHINEDKRKTESRMAIFDIFNDIDGCPAHLVSSNRKFILKCEVTELSDNLSGRGDALMLYLFSDTIEVCKKRSRGFNSAKSPSSNKSLKHVKLMSLNAIRFVIDITDSPRAFALLCRQDKDKLHSFTLADEELDKVLYLKTLCKQMAENACRTDTDKALLCRTSQELEVDISDVNLSTLSKAFKLAARTRLKVGRAFSFNKTPSKLKRAVSTMMTSPFGSTNSLTPASQLAQMRLASCTNIHEAVDEECSNRSSSPSTQSEIILPPMSVQPMRKNKSSTLSVGRI